MIFGSDKNKSKEKELKRRQFILNGNLWLVVLVIVLPLFFYSLLNYVYGIIDMVMCSNISKDAVSAVAVLDQVKNMISSIGAGLASGGSILIARQIGKNNYDRARKMSTTVFIITVLIAVITCSITIPLAPLLLNLLKVPQDFIDIGLKYFIISIVTASIIMFNTVFMGVEKARGSTAKMTILNIGVILLKVLISYIFIYICQFKDMMYVSLATMIANLTLTIYIVFKLWSKSYIFHFSFKEKLLNKPVISKITFISFPIFLGKFIFSLGKVVINSMCKIYSNDVVGALGVSNQMGGAVTNALSSFEDGSSSIISQNLGNNNTKRALQTFGITLLYTLVIALIGVVLVTIFNDQMVELYAHGDQEYAKLITEIFQYEKLGIVFLGINSAVLGLLYGFGYTKVSMVLNLARVFVFRIPILWIFQTFTDVGYKSVGWAMGLSNISIGVMAIVSAIIAIIHIRKKMKIKEEAKVLSLKQKEKVNLFIDKYLEDFKDYKDGRWCYEDGVVLLGAYNLFKATKDEKYLKFCEDYFDTHIGENGELIGYDLSIHSIDNIQAGMCLEKINEISPKEKYQKAIETLAKQMKEQPRTNSKSYWHKDRYPNQVWLDGLYMGLPFYAEYGVLNHDNDIKENVLLQFSNVKKDNYDKEKNLYFHAFDETKSMQWADKETGLSPNIWLRSVGWLLMAICDCYEIYNSNADLLSEAKLKPLLKDVFQSMEPYADKETGLYKDLPLVEDENNYIETSGSCMFAYSYIKGARLKIIKSDEAIKGAKMFETIVDKYLDDEGLANICQVSGLDNEKRDGSVRYYLSEKKVYNDAKGVGPFMMAYAEYLKFTK